MTLNINSFKSQLVDGGARGNLFRVVVNFPGFVGGDVEKTSFLCRATSIPGAQVGTVNVPFRGRQLKLPCDRTINLTVDSRQVLSPQVVRTLSFSVEAVDCFQVLCDFHRVLSFERTCFRSNSCFFD